MSAGKMITILIALGLGGAGAWYFLPGYQTHLALNKIASPNRAQRDLGWNRLLHDRDDASIAQSQLSRIIRILREAPDDALLDAGSNLRQINLWNWENIPSKLIVREIDLLSLQADVPPRVLAAGELLEGPLDLPGDLTLPLFARLLADSDQQVRSLALQGALGWIGPGQGELLDQLGLEFSDPILRHQLELAREFSAQQEATFSPVPPFIHNRQEAGLLGGGKYDPAELGNDVYIAALRAESQLARSVAIELAEEWITDFNDDRKQAGAMLAALLGEPAQLLVKSHQSEDRPEVRLIQRLALLALDLQPDSPENIAPLELAHRSIHRPNGEFDPDVALCLLASGNAPTLALLTIPPPENDPATLGHRLRLIRRFIPALHDPLASRANSPSRSVSDHFDSLEVLRLLWQRRLIFEKSTRTFILPEQTEPNP